MGSKPHLLFWERYLGHEKWQDSSWTPTLPPSNSSLPPAGKRRHREGKWLPKSGFQEPTPPAHPVGWERAVEEGVTTWLEGPKRKAGRTEQKAARSQPSAGRPAGHRCSRSWRLRVQRLLSSGGELFSLPRVEQRGPGESPPPPHLTHGKRKAQGEVTCSRALQREPAGCGSLRRPA